MKRITGAAQTLDKIARQPGTIGLYWIQCRKRLRECREGADVIDSTVVDSKGGSDRQVVEIRAKLGIVSPNAPEKIVGELIALFDALNVGVRLAAKISKSRNVNGRIGARGDLRVVKVR